jgi:LmbE family N-acetylglucosaminyl deacetylase
MRWIYLSPHLDDAVFSVGGLIYDQAQAGLPVEIWTFMCGTPEPDVGLSLLAQSVHMQWGFSSAEEAVRMRRDEDRRAAALLGATPFHFDFLDCIYRRGGNGREAWLYSDIFVPPHPEDAGLPSQIGQALSARLEPDDVLVCPLAVGSHPDHVLVRQGAERVGRPLLYDVDVPYILTHPGEGEAKTAGMKESVHLVTETGLGRWQEAASAYTSQLAALGDPFDTPEKVRAAIRAYWAECRGIRLFGTE